MLGFMDAAQLRAEAAQLLQGCRTASLATAGPQGAPHAANVQFVADEALNVYFVSAAQSLHARHIAASGQAALTVYDHQDAEPGTIRGLQMHGRCERVTAADRSRVWKRYAVRFPFIEASPPLRAAVEAQPFFVVRPTWLRLIDNRRGFGFKAEVSLSTEHGQTL